MHPIFSRTRGNQIQPLILSNKGLYVWSEEPYRFGIKGDSLVITGKQGRGDHGKGRFQPERGPRLRVGALLSSIGRNAR